MQSYAYNEKTANNAIKMLLSKHECAVIQATGTGKSYIAMAIIERLFLSKKILYVVPRTAIADSIKLYEEWKYPNVVFKTYSAIIRDHDKYDVVILDELHRAGAPVWQNAVKVLKSSAEYILGLTATPERYLDGRRNMAIELFGDNIVYGPDLTQALAQGILPLFQYIVILTDVVEYVEMIGKYKPNLPTKIKLKSLNLEEYNLAQRVRKYTVNAKGKWIVFCDSTESMLNLESTIQDWFDYSVTVKYVSSSRPRKVNKAIVEEFNATVEPTVLLSVSMLNEGAHLSGVTGVILASKTESGNVFLQRLGRALSASDTDRQPVIIDLAHNYKNLKIIENSGTKLVRDLEQLSTDSNELVAIRKLIAYDDVILSIEAILEQLSSTWASWEDDILYAYYKIEGSDTCLRLNNKQGDDVINRAKLLGITRNVMWTEYEDDILRTHSKKERDILWKYLPERTQGAIDGRLRKLGLIRSWTPSEDLILMKHWDLEYYDVYLRLPGRDVDEIVNRARKLGLVGGD